MRAALGLRLRLLFLLKLGDARVGLIGRFRKHQQIVATEALRHEKWQLETQPSLSTPKVSSFNAFSHYQDW